MSDRIHPELEGGELSLVDLVNLVMRHRWLVFGVPLLLSAVLVALTVTKPRQYTATASLLPQSGQGSASRLSGLAAQFGINVGGGDPGQSPAFYSALLESREILEPVAKTRFGFRAGGDSLSGTPMDLLEIEGATDAERLESAVQALDARTSVTADRQTGMVKVTVQTPWAPLSYQIVERMLVLLTEFNVEQRQSRARTEREFVEQQLDQARRELRSAENQLQGFLQRNRMFESDPQLVFEHDRLRRNVSMRQEVFTTLAQAYEQARLDAVRDTPPMTVVERPRIPARGDSRGTPMRALLGLVLGGMLGIVLAVARDFFARRRAGASIGATTASAAG